MSRNRIPLFRLLVRIILFLVLIIQSDNGFFDCEVSVDQTRILRDLQVLGGFRDILASLLLLGLFSNECYRGAWPPAKKRCRCTQASWEQCKSFRPSCKTYQSAVPAFNVEKFQAVSHSKQKSCGIRRNQRDGWRHTRLSWKLGVDWGRCSRPALAG